MTTPPPTAGLAPGLSVLSVFTARGAAYAAVNGPGFSGLLRRGTDGAWAQAALPPAGGTAMRRTVATASGAIFSLGGDGNVYRLAASGDWVRAIRRQPGAPIRDLDAFGETLVLRTETADRRSAVEIRDLVANTATILPALPAAAGAAAPESLRFDAAGTPWYLDAAGRAFAAAPSGWVAQGGAALPTGFAVYGTTTPAPQQGAPLSIGREAWTDVTQGLPTGAKIGGLVALDNRLYASAGVDGSRYGLWRLDLGGWTQVSRPPADLRDLAAAGGRLYGQARGTLWEYDPGRDTWLNVGRLAAIPAGSQPAIASDGAGRVYVFGGVSETPSIQVFDTATRQWTDLGRIAGRSFASGAAQLLADGSGAVWFATARDGIWRYGGTGWEQATTRTGRLSLDEGGRVLLSYAAGTRMVVAAYAGGTGDTAWTELRRFAAGAAAPGVTLDNGITVFGGGRYAEVALRGDTGWTLPSMEAARDDGAGNRDARVGDLVAIGNTVFAVQQRGGANGVTVQALTVHVPRAQATAVWQDVSPTLPTGARVTNLVALGHDVYASVEKAGAQTGLWRAEGDGWRFVAASPGLSSIADMAAGGDGRLYAIVSGTVRRFDPAAGAWTTVNPSSELRFAALAGFGDRIAGLLQIGADPLVQVLDTTTGRWTDLGRVSATPLQGGSGGNELRIDANGQVWLKFGSAGLWRNDGTGWQQVSTRAGSIGIGADGAVYYAWETAPGTQITGIHRYVGGSGDGAFRLVQTVTGNGLGLSGVPFGDSGVFIGGGRFDEVVFDGSRIARLPSMEAGQPDPNTIDARVRDTVVVDGVIYAIQDRDNVDVRRVLRLDAEAAAASVFDSNLDVEVAGYLTDGARPAAAAGVELLADGRIAALYNQGSGTDTATYAEGRLDILSADGRTRLASVGLGGRVLDADLIQGPQGERLAVALPTGIVVVDPATGGIVARAAGTARRVAGLEDGSFVGLFDYQVPVPGVTRMQTERRVEVHGADGALLRSFTLSQRSYVNDIEVNPRDGLIYVVGFDNKRLPDGLPVQVAFLSALDLATGQPRWQTYGFNGADLSKNVADTRLYRVEMGADGALYLGGESAGTESVFRFDGRRFEGEQTISNFDAYTSLSNTASPHLTFIGRVDPATGLVQDGVYSEARVGADSNTYRIVDGDLAVDAEGVIYQTGISAARIANRDAQFIEGVRSGGYAGGDPVFQVLAPDFDSRYAWNALVGPGGGSGTANAVATRGGKTVVLSTIRAGEGAVTEGALFGSRTAPANVHLTVVDAGRLFGEAPGVDSLGDIDTLLPPIGSATASPSALAASGMGTGGLLATG